MELRKAPKASLALGIPRISITQVWWRMTVNFSSLAPPSRGLPNLGITKIVKEKEMEQYMDYSFNSLMNVEPVVAVEIWGMTSVIPQDGWGLVLDRKIHSKYGSFFETNHRFDDRNLDPFAFSAFRPALDGEQYVDPIAVSDEGMIWYYPVRTAKGLPQRGDVLIVKPK
jgi:hypothetical protein